MTGGSLFLAEVQEQPLALRRLLERGPEICEVGARLAAISPPVFRLVGHGSSDNAAAFGIYALGLIGGRTAMRDSISLTTYYGADIDFTGGVVIALSQSGRTPDVVTYVERARAGGATTVAVTNDPGSALASAADLTVLLAAGEEAAVAATKTYTNQLAALVLLAAGAAGRRPEFVEALGRVADLFEEAIAVSQSAAKKLASAFGFTGRMFVIGRGLEFATARELALKLTETCGIAAEPLTATALVHGPIAALDPLFPVWAIASNDAGLSSVSGGGPTGQGRGRDRGSERLGRRPGRRSRVPPVDPGGPQLPSTHSSRSCRGSSSPGRSPRSRVSTRTSRRT